MIFNRFNLMALLMALFSISACASCSTENDDLLINEPEQDDPSPDTEASDTDNSGNVLVAFFSCTNTTKDIAEEIASITGGTLFGIEAATPYTPADLNYNTDCRANREQNDPKSRPAIKQTVKDLNKYDIVFWVILSGGARLHAL